MNESLLHIWGVNEEITILEIVARAIVMFLLVYIVIRISGMRIFRKNSPFDMVIAFLIGGVLSRGVVGATPFVSAFTGGLALIILQKIFYKLSFNHSFEKLIKGEKVLVYKDGRFFRKNMKEVDITKLEIFEDLRVDHQTESLDKVKEIYVEKTGETSFIMK